MLDTRGLTVRYGEVTAVDAVDLTVPDGSVLALLGPSGCGKSTLLRAVAGLEPSATGTVTWDGVDLARIPVHRRGFGLMFQEGVLFPHRTVAGNVRYGLLWGAARAGRVAELLDMVGLAGYEDRRVSTLSGGEAQRVALARALAPAPRLLLLDEPLAALDRSLRDQLLQDLRAVLETTGTTAIFVTHDQDEAFTVADRIAVMRGGLIVDSGEPRAVFSAPADAWVATFLGCTAVLGATPRQDDAGAWHSVIPALGAVAGRAERVGLRPSALLVDDTGPIAAEVTAVTGGPERARLTVQVRGSAEDQGAADVLPDPGIPDLAAVAHPATTVWVGEVVRLRFDPHGAAAIRAPAP